MRTWMAMGAVLLAVGCGDDGDDGGSFSSGLPAEKPLADVGEADAKAMCENGKQAMQSIMEGLGPQGQCRLFAVLLTRSPADCRALESQCAQSGGLGPDDDEEEEECDFDGEKLAKCEGTIGEYEACVNDSLAAMRRLLSGLSCDDAGTLAGGRFEAQKPSSCEQLEEKCPGILDDDDDDDQDTGGPTEK